MRVTLPVLAALLAAALAVPSADAATFTNPDATPNTTYSRIAATLPVPVPDAAIMIWPSVSGCDGGEACEWWTQREPDPRQYFIAIRPDILIAFRREYFTHELGHVFDETDMTNADRSAFKKIMHYHGSWSTGADSPPNELFADAYSMCATRPVLVRDPRNSYGGYGYLPTRKQHDQVCALIRRAGARPARPSESAAPR